MKYIIWALALAVGLGVGKVYAADNKIAAIVIKDCLKQIEWVGITTPEKWMLLHITEIDPDKLKVFISTYSPKVFQSPDKCI